MPLRPIVEESVSSEQSGQPSTSEFGAASRSVPTMSYIVPVKYHRQLNVLLTLMCDFEQWLSKEEVLTSQRRSETQRRLEEFVALRHPFNVLMDKLVAELSGEQGDWFEEFTKKFQGPFETLLHRANTTLNPALQKPAPVPRSPQDMFMEAPRVEGNVDLNVFSDLSDELQEIEKLSPKARETKKVRDDINLLRRKFFQTLVDLGDVRLVEAMNSLRRRFLSL